MGEDWRRQAAALREAFLTDQPGTAPEDYEGSSYEMQQAYGRWRMTGPVASYLGFWRHCRFPECRRARACRGLAPPLDLSRASFPPCAHDDSERHDAIVEVLGRAFKDEDLLYSIWPRPSRPND